VDRVAKSGVGLDLPNWFWSCVVLACSKHCPRFLNSDRIRHRHDQEATELHSFQNDAGPVLEHTEEGETTRNRVNLEISRAVGTAVGSAENLNHSSHASTDLLSVHSGGEAKKKGGAERNKEVKEKLERVKDKRRGIDRQLEDQMECKCENLEANTALEHRSGRARRSRERAFALKLAFRTQAPDMWKKGRGGGGGGIW